MIHSKEMIVRYGLFRAFRINLNQFLLRLLPTLIKLFTEHLLCSFIYHRPVFFHQSFVLPAVLL